MIYVPGGDKCDTVSVQWFVIFWVGITGSGRKGPKNKLTRLLNIQLYVTNLDEHWKHVFHNRPLPNNDPNPGRD